MCGGWFRQAFTATLLLDPSTTALLIIRKSLLAMTDSTNTNREIIAFSLPQLARF